MLSEEERLARDAQVAKDVAEMYVRHAKIMEKYGMYAGAEVLLFLLLLLLFLPLLLLFLVY